MMEYFYTFLVALSLALHAYSTAYWGGIYRCLSPREILNMVIAFVIFQTAMFWLGSISGTSFSSTMGWLSFPIAEAIILLTGIKLIFSAIRIRPEQKSFNLGKTGELVAVSFASSLNAFMAGLGIGLLRPISVLMIIAISLFVAVLSIAGVYAGKKQGRIIYTTFAGVTAGTSLIVLAVILALDLYEVI